MPKRPFLRLIHVAAALVSASANAAPLFAPALPASRQIELARGFRAGPVIGYRGAYAGAWRRPYAWPPGGAIAAGAAVGVMTADDAIGYATVAAPADGLCWYYTDENASQGFWDVCQ
ncbi:hypothetical protein [Methylocystis sp. S23]